MLIPSESNKKKGGSKLCVSNSITLTTEKLKTWNQSIEKEKQKYN